MGCDIKKGPLFANTRQNRALLSYTLYTISSGQYSKPIYYIITQLNNKFCNAEKLAKSSDYVLKSESAWQTHCTWIQKF